MTPQQRKNKIDELEFWLKNNPNHPNIITIETYLIKLRTTQAENETYERATN